MEFLSDRSISSGLPKIGTAHAAATSHVPASDAQLLRLGRHLGLSHQEAEVMLELLEDPDLELKLPPEDRDRPGGFLHELPTLLHCLRCVPGVFLFTDGVTLSRMERALQRALALFHAGTRIRRLLHLSESAAHREARLLHRVAHTLLSGIRAGKIPVPPYEPPLLTLLQGLIGAFARRRHRTMPKGAHKRTAPPAQTLPH